MLYQTVKHSIWEGCVFVFGFEKKHKEPSLLAEEKKGGNVGTHHTVKTMMGLCEYVEEKESAFKSNFRTARSCPEDGIITGVEDAVKLVIGNGYIFDFSEGLRTVRNLIEHGIGLRFPYPLHNMRCSLWDRAYASGVGVVLEWISEYECS